jgi:hypothetical protein
VAHQTCDERRVSAEPIELGDNDRDILAGELKPLRVSEASNCFALSLESEARPLPPVLAADKMTRTDVEGER